MEDQQWSRAGVALRYGAATDWNHFGENHLKLFQQKPFAWEADIIYNISEWYPNVLEMFAIAGIATQNKYSCLCVWKLKWKLNISWQNANLNFGILHRKCFCDLSCRLVLGLLINVFIKICEKSSQSATSPALLSRIFLLSLWLAEFNKYFWGTC